MASQSADGSMASLSGQNVGVAPYNRLRFALSNGFERCHAEPDEEPQMKLSFGSIRASL